MFSPFHHPDRPEDLNHLAAFAPGSNQGETIVTADMVPIGMATGHWVIANMDKMTLVFTGRLFGSRCSTHYCPNAQLQAGRNPGAVAHRIQCPEYLFEHRPS